MTAKPGTGYAKLNEADLARPYTHLYDGDGTLRLSHFRFDGAPAPANFVVYDMPPGSSEGVHTHRLGDTPEGPFDEFYYVIQGEGEMLVDGETVAIRAGDCVHAPLGAAHGVRNTQAAGHLRLFLTFIRRAG